MNRKVFDSQSVQPNEYVHLVDQHDPEHSAQGRYSKNEKEIVPLQKQDDNERFFDHRRV